MKNGKATLINGNVRLRNGNVTQKNGGVTKKDDSAAKKKHKARLFCLFAAKINNKILLFYPKTPLPCKKAMLICAK
jgi:hypothetical protein